MFHWTAAPMYAPRAAKDTAAIISPCCMSALDGIQNPAHSARVADPANTITPADHGSNVSPHALPPVPMSRTSTTQDRDSPNANGRTCRPRHNQGSSVRAIRRQLCAWRLDGIRVEPDGVAADCESDAVATKRIPAAQLAMTFSVIVLPDVGPVAASGRPPARP